MPCTLLVAYFAPLPSFDFWVLLQQCVYNIYYMLNIRVGNVWHLRKAFSLLLLLISLKGINEEFCGATMINITWTHYMHLSPLRAFQSGRIHEPQFLKTLSLAFSLLNKLTKRIYHVHSQNASHSGVICIFKMPSSHGKNIFVNNK